MKAIQVMFVVTLLTISDSANAVIVDNGKFTTDTASNLDWLDLSFTQSKSYFEIDRLLGTGTGNNPTLNNFNGFNAATTEKWSFATSTQLDSFIFNFTGLNVNGVNASTNANLLDGLIGMLGKTYISPNLPDTVYSSRGMISGLSQSGSLVEVKALDRYLNNSGQDVPRISTSFLNSGNDTRPDVGVFLVRTSQYVLPSAVASVPESETYAMFLAGLGLLGFATRRKAK